MSSAADGRANKRAAASRAEGKIKKTLEEIGGWSASDVSSGSDTDVCSRLSDFDDLQGHANKKTRNESNKEETKETTDSEASSKEGVSGNDPTKSDDTTEKETTEHKDSEATALTSSSSSSDSSTESPVETAKSYRELRAEARNQHSTGPMILSRRLSWKLAKAEPSPVYSPITAKRLAFTPATSNVKAN